MSEISYLEYLNKILPANTRIHSLQELTSGVHLHQILLQSGYQVQFTYDCPTFIQRIRNIKSLIKTLNSLNIYRLPSCDFDIIKIVKYQTHQEIYKLVTYFIKILLHSSQRDFFIQKILETSQQTQQLFMELLKQQSSMEKKSPLKLKQNLYDKFLELQDQNESLLKIMQQITQQSIEQTHKNKDLEDKLDERDSQIKKLYYQINQITLRKSRVKKEAELQTQQIDKEVNQELANKFKELQERLKHTILELENAQFQIKEKTASLSKIKTQISFIKQENFGLNAFIADLEEKLSKSCLKIKTLNEKIADQRQSFQQKQSQIKSLQANIKSLSQQMITKQELIDHLQHLIERLVKEIDAHENVKQNRTSVKAECKELFQTDCNKTNQVMVLKLKKQTESLNQKLNSALAIIEIKNKQIEVLKLHQEENKKLVHMISHMQKYRGQQNQVLVKCLYKMRMKMLGLQMQKGFNQPQLRQALSPLIDSNKNY